MAAAHSPTEGSTTPQLYEARNDLHHGLTVSALQAGDADRWFGHPWVEENGITDPDGFDINYDAWSSAFAPKLPDTPFRAELSTVDPDAPVPDGLSVEAWRDAWIVRGSGGDYWGEVQGNGRAGDNLVDEIPPLVFESPELAHAAYLAARRLYDEIAARQKVIDEALGIDAE